MHVGDIPDLTQDYLKVIYDLTEWDNQPATPSKVSQALNQKASTTSEGLKRLVAQGLIIHERYQPIELTETGRTLALQMVRRHRLIEMYLCEQVGYSWDEVHDEAELLEHAVSDLFVDRIDALLGHPTRDPHGDPIPRADGHIEDDSTLPLDAVAEGQCVVIDRISDHDPELLRDLASREILPGARIHVVKTYRDPFALDISVCPSSEPSERHTVHSDGNAHDPAQRGNATSNPHVNDDQGIVLSLTEKTTGLIRVRILGE